jgi:putative aminopeptidase FrvX
MKKLKKHSCDVYAVASTQEEVGLRGAMTSAYHIAPDIGVALDTTIAGDIPGGNEAEQVTELGGGVAIKIKDSSCISHPGLVKFTRDLAKKYKIKHQMEILSGGGTDSGAIQKSREGVITITLSIPTRYIHSVVETENKKDIKAAIDLLAKFLENIDKFKAE